MKESFNTLFRPPFDNDFTISWRIRNSKTAQPADWHCECTVLGLSGVLHLAVRQHPSVAMGLSPRDATAEAVEVSGRGRFPVMSRQSSQDANENDHFAVRVEQGLWTGGSLRPTCWRNRIATRASAVVSPSQQCNMVKGVGGSTEFGRLEATKRVRAAQQAYGT